MRDSVLSKCAVNYNPSTIHLNIATWSSASPFPLSRNDPLSQSLILPPTTPLPAFCNSRTATELPLCNIQYANESYLFSWRHWMVYCTDGSPDTLHCNVAMWPKITRVSTGGWIIWVRTGKGNLNWIQFNYVWSSYNVGWVGLGHPVVWVRLG